MKVVGMRFALAASSVTGGTAMHVAALRSVTEWLTHNGLGIDLDKTEYISFQPPCASTRHIGYQVDNLSLGLPGGRVLSVQWSNTV